MNRRESLQMIGAASAGAMLTPGSLLAQSGRPPLKEIARSRGLLFGAESEVPISQQPPAYGELYARECELFLPVVSWEFLSPQPGVENFGRDTNIAWAASHKLRFSGGQLLWYKRIPEWVISASPNDFKADVENHIQSVCKNFPGDTFSWTVVNEAIEPKDGRPDGLRDSHFIEKMGTNFFDDVFRVARKAAPKAMLAYNDAVMEMDMPAHAGRRSGLLRLLDQWKKQGTPIDAIGLQTHIHAKDMEYFNEKLYRKFLKTIAGYGLRIILTELDVLDIGAPSSLDARDRTVADIYRRILDVALDEPATCAVMTWGLSDAASWYNKRGAPAGYMRSDGTPERPLLFDPDFKPKASLLAVADALSHAPVRPLPANA